jgi:hypothetical protein
MPLTLDQHWDRIRTAKSDGELLAAGVAMCEASDRGEITLTRQTPAEATAYFRREMKRWKAERKTASSNPRS